MKRIILPYNPRLKILARQLRSSMTLSEVLLWNKLKSSQMLGFDFDRQRPIDEYIVDFYCKELMLAIEIDGQSHNHPEAYQEDCDRQQRLESLRVHFLRFEDQAVKRDMVQVLGTIENWIIDKQEKDTNINGRRF